MNNVLILGMGAFGFAITHHLTRLHPTTRFSIYEKNPDIIQTIESTGCHPYFFPGVQLDMKRIELVRDLDSLLPKVDILIIAIPTQVIARLFDHIAPLLKRGVIIVNLAKGIDHQSLLPISDIIAQRVGDAPYTYSVLSGGMIAEELVNSAPLGATIAISDMSVGNILMELFQGESLEISLSSDYRDVELIGAIKNIFAMTAGYYEGKGYGYSTVGYALTRLYSELPILLQTLGGTGELRFREFAVGGDIIATCFGASRNRQFGRLVGEGYTALEARDILQREHRFAEGYETLIGLRTLIVSIGLPHFQAVVDIFFGDD